MFLPLYEHPRVRVFFFCFAFSRFVQQETSMWYHMIRNVVFAVFGGTLLRPTAGAVVLIRKSTTLQNVLGYVRAYRRSPARFRAGLPPRHLP